MPSVSPPTISALKAVVAFLADDDMPEAADALRSIPAEEYAHAVGVLSWALALSHDRLVAPTEPVDQKPTVDLTGMSPTEVAAHEGDPALEATLARLQREVETPREAVSGFSSAI